MTGLPDCRLGRLRITSNLDSKQFFGALRRVRALGLMSGAINKDIPRAAPFGEWGPEDGERRAIRAVTIGRLTCPSAARAHRR